MKGETVWIVVGVGCLVAIVLGFFGAIGGAIYMLRTGDELGVPVPPMPAPMARDPVAPAPVQPAAPTQPAAPAPPPTTTEPFAIGTPPPAGVRVVRATVTASSGLADVTVGTLCSVEIRRGDDSDQCHAQIDCGPRHLYGSESLGYFDCTLSVGGARPDVQGEDTLTTTGDSDPAMSLDTSAGLLSLRDDETGALGAFAVTANVESVAYAEASR